MSNSAKSLLVFGIYLSVQGSILLVIPNVLLGLFGIPETNEVWIRILGLLLVLVSFYYVQAARSELTNFFQWTVYTRTVLLVSMVLFVLLADAPPIIILFGFADFAGAMWTQFALRSDRARV